MNRFVILAKNNYLNNVFARCKQITLFLLLLLNHFLFAQPNAKLDMITTGHFKNLRLYTGTVNICYELHPSGEALCGDTTGNRPSAGDTTFYYFSYNGNYDTLYVLSNGSYGPLPPAAVSNANIYNTSFKFNFIPGCHTARLIVKNITGRDTSDLVFCRDAPDGSLSRTGTSDTVCFNSAATITYTMNPISGSIDSVKWNFGDTVYTTTSYTTSHLFTFSKLGKRIVKVTIYDMGTACDKNDIYDTLYVTFDDNLTISDSAGCPCNNIILTGVSPNASVFTWSFPDTTLTGSTVNYTSSKPGGQYVSVIGVAANGCVISKTKYIDVCPGEYISSESGNYWYFGGSGLNFNTIPPAPLSNGRLVSLEGCAAASDPFTGTLLFYTNGVYVYDRNHNQMPNGSGLFAHESSAQGALIVPRPGNKDQYFIFTVGGAFGITTKRLHYSIVDITLNGGMGDVLTKNVQVIPDGPGNSSSEMLTGLLKSPADCDSTDKYWIVNPVELAGVWNFNTYEVTANGPVLRQSNPLTTGSYRHTEIISSTFSPDGKLYAAGNRPGGFVLMDFDNATGILSNVRHVETGSPSYGIAFSADGKKLYVTRFLNSMLQFDLSIPTAIAIAATQVKLDSTGTFRGLYRGPDDKIYVNEQGTTGVIHFPNIGGTGCMYEAKKYTYSSQYMLMGLQNIVPLYLDTNQLKTINTNFTYSKDTCPGNYLCYFNNKTDSILPLTTYDPCKFNPRDTLFFEWNYGDGGTPDTFLIVQGGNQQHTHPVHNYPGVGTYSVQLISWSTFTCKPDTFNQTITFNPTPAPTIINPPPYCDSAFVGGSWYYASQSVLDTLTGAGTNGCDSIVQINIVITNGGSSVINPVSCLSYTSPSGKVFTSGGTYLDTIPSFNGCDSLITINLTLGSTVTNTVSLPGCDSVFANGSWYYSPQTINDTIPGGAVGGCDSIVIANIVINNSQSNSGNISICSGENTLIHGINQNTAGVYTQTFTSSNGCDSTSSITLNVLPVYLNIDSVSSCDSIFFNGLWYSSTQTINDTLATSSGCDSILSTHINITQTPPLVIVPAMDSITKGSSITLTASGAGSYLWYNGNTTANITIVPTQSSYYCVVGNNGNCIDSVCAQIIVIDTECGDKIYVPTAFSPNDDGQNDKLCIYGVNCIKAININIYDRWGEMVYSSSDPSECWDGIFKNKKLDSGVFTFKLTAVLLHKEEITVSGNITLVR